MAAGSHDKNRRDADEGSSLEARARRIASATSTQEGAAKKDKSQGAILETLREFNENIGFIQRTATSIRTVLAGLWATFISPLWRVLRPPLAFLWRWYMKIWNRWAYTIDSKTNERKISRVRSSLVVLLTLLFLSVFTDTLVGSCVRFCTIEPLVDGVLIVASKRTEVFYLTQSDEIDPDLDIYAVRGCRKRGQCSEVDAAYFRVRPRLSHDIWKLIEYGNPVYVPNHVVAPIAPGLNECKVTYYGYRMTSSWIARILRSLQFYPTMLEAECRYLGADQHANVDP